MRFVIVFFSTIYSFYIKIELYWLYWFPVGMLRVHSLTAAVAVFTIYKNISIGNQSTVTRLTPLGCDITKTEEFDGPHCKTHGKFRQLHKLDTR